MKIDYRHSRQVHATLADGTKRSYYYYGRGKGAKRLKGEPGSREFEDSYRATAAKKLADDDITQKLIDATSIQAASSGSPSARRRTIAASP